MANQQGHALDDLRNTISEVSRIIRHRWRLGLIGLCLVASGAFWYSQYLPREYNAATLFERRDDVVLQNLIKGNSPYSFDHLKSTMTLDMIGSRALARAAARAGLLPPETFTDEGALTEDERKALDGALGRYKLRPHVKLTYNSASLDTILLTCTANDPRKARDFVVAIRDNYIEDTLERIRQILGRSKEFFESEVARLQSDIAGLDEQLRESFEEFPGMDLTDLSGVGARLENLRAQREEVYQRKADLEAQISAREEFLAAAPEIYAGLDAAADVPAAGPLAQPRPATDPVIAARIEKVKLEIVDLTTDQGMTTEHPTVRGKIARLHALHALQEALAEAMPEPDSPVAYPTSQAAVSQAYRDWNAQRMRVEMELDSLRRQLDITEQRHAEALARVQKFEALYQKLIDQDDALRDLRDRRNEASQETAVWDGYLSRLDRVLTAESGQRGTQFALIEEPKQISRPTKPQISSVFLVSGGLGLAAAALLVALAELFDRSFRSVGQVSRSLGVPVLECISVIPTPRERRRAFASRLIWTPALTLLLLLLVLTAGLAYSSIARPALYESTLQKFGRALHVVGVAAILPSRGPAM